MASTALQQTSFLEIIKSMTKGKQIAENGTIYLYGGHGNDVCDKNSKEVVIDTVPDNCIYISSAECGKITYANFLYNEFFMSSKEEDKKLIREIFSSEKKRQEFAEKVGISPDSLHIHYPGMKYVVNIFSPFAYYNNKDIDAIMLSGLMEKSKIEKCNKEDIISYFKPALLEDVRKLTTPEYPREELLTRLKDLFRSHSVHAVVDMLNTQYAELTFETNVPHKDKLSFSETVPFLAKIFDYFPREQVVNHFKASVFPTQEDIQDILKNRSFISNKDFEDVHQAIRRKLGESDRFNMLYNSNSPLSNKSLMEQFPGIHFNFTCRNVAQDCDEKTTARRQASTETHKEMTKTSLGGSRMPTPTRKNRINELKRVKSQATKKQNFQIQVPKTIIPGQLIQLFTTSLKNDYPGRGLKENNPKEYLKQKQKIQYEKNKAARRYNRNTTRRGPGSRGSATGTSTVQTNSILAWMKRLGW